MIHLLKVDQEDILLRRPLAFVLYTGAKYCYSCPDRLPPGNLLP